MSGGLPNNGAQSTDILPRQSQPNDRLFKTIASLIDLGLLQDAEDVDREMSIHIVGVASKLDFQDLDTHAPHADQDEQIFAKMSLIKRSELVYNAFTDDKATLLSLFDIHKTTSALHLRLLLAPQNFPRYVRRQWHSGKKFAIHRCIQELLSSIIGRGVSVDATWVSVRSLEDIYSRPLLLTEDESQITLSNCDAYDGWQTIVAHQKGEQIENSHQANLSLQRLGLDAIEASMQSRQRRSHEFTTDLLKRVIETMVALNANKESVTHLRATGVAFIPSYSEKPPLLFSDVPQASREQLLTAVVNGPTSDFTRKFGGASVLLVRNHQLLAEGFNKLEHISMRHRMQLRKTSRPSLNSLDSRQQLLWDLSQGNMVTMPSSDSATEVGNHNAIVSFISAVSNSKNGILDESIEQLRSLLEVDPCNYQYIAWICRNYYLKGDIDVCHKLIRLARLLSNSRGYLVPLIEAAGYSQEEFFPMFLDVGTLHDFQRERFLRWSRVDCAFFSNLSLETATRIPDIDPEDPHVVAVRELSNEIAFATSSGRISSAELTGFRDRIVQLIRTY